MLCPEESCKVVTEIVFRPANSPVVLAITGPTVVPSVTRKVVVTFITPSLSLLSDTDNVPACM